MHWWKFAFTIGCNQMNYQFQRKDIIMECITLSNGVKIPKLGFGVFQIPAEETAQAVKEALEVGYRHIDTAQAYVNETEVGEGIRQSGVDCKDIFLTTKVWISEFGYEKAKKICI